MELLGEGQNLEEPVTIAGSSGPYKGREIILDEKGYENIEQLLRQLKSLWQFIWSTPNWKPYD